jgi:hypothetical protein
MLYQDFKVNSPSTCLKGPDLTSAATLSAHDFNKLASLPQQITAGSFLLGMNTKPCPLPVDHDR